jgi:hypothetical protein
MDLVTPVCFAGLSQGEKRLQLYGAFYNWADDDTLLDPSCFRGDLHQDDAVYLAIATANGDTPVCFGGLSQDDKFLAVYTSLFDSAGDDTLTDPECVRGLSPEYRMQAFYASLYSIAGDGTLTDPDCFLGLSPEDRTTAIFEAASIVSEGQLTLAAVTGLQVLGDDDGTWDADWDPMGDADYYQYRIDGGASTNTLDVAVSGAGLAPGTYEFEVRSRDNDGNRGPWASQNFTIESSELNLFWGTSEVLFGDSSILFSDLTYTP